MKLVFRIALLLLIFCAPQMARAAAGDINAASRSVVRVALMSELDGQPVFVGHGSGIVVAPDMILTNAHVVEEANYDDTISFSIIPSQGKKSYKATLLHWNPNNDLALLKITDGKLTPAVLFGGNMPDGADIFAIGYPANVDVALQQQDADTLKPQAPIKTRGSVSVGRSSKRFETILHTAPIAPGNSGGPIVDSCGRVVGINSFGSTAESGGSEFYFAVAIKEVAAFLRSQKVSPRTVSNSCRSAAELSQAEAKREAAARAKIEGEQRVAAELRASIEGKTRRDAEFQVIAERENQLALAGLLMALSLFASGAAIIGMQRGLRPLLVGGTMACIGLFVAAILTFLYRPSFDQVDELVRKALAEEAEEDGPATPSASASGKMICHIQPERSRITVSSDADVSFDWKAFGCVNGRTQYADDRGKWSRSFVPNSDAQVSVVSFSPSKGIYQINRYLLGSNAMDKARAARSRYRVRGCSANPDKRKKVADMNAALRDVLPDQPNETLTFACKSAGK